MVDFVKPSELPPASQVYTDDAIVVDNNGLVQKGTPKQVVDAGAPVATEAQALAGTNNERRMTPLRVKQVIDSTSGGAVARAQAWAESPTNPDPTDPESKSSKTWAEISEAAALASSKAPQNWDDFQREPFLDFQDGAVVSFNGVGFARDRSANIAGLLTGGGWSPYGITCPEHFGAIGDGIYDDTSSFKSAWEYVCSLTSGRIFSMDAKNYNLASLTSSLNPVSNLTVKGAGIDATIIRWNDYNGSLAFNSLFGQQSSPITNVSFSGFHIRGSHDSDYIPRSKYPILLGQITGLKITDVKCTYSRVMGMAVRSSSEVLISGCVIEYCARDGINTAGCYSVSIIGNHVSFCDDDAIATHTQYYYPPDRGTVISGNTIRFSQGIRSLGARTVAISGNTIEFFMSQGISVDPIATSSGGIEGVNAMSGVSISGNVIKNGINRTIVDNLNQGAPYISLGGLSASSGELDYIPGEAGSEGISLPYQYYENAINGVTTSPVPGSIGVSISANSIVRDIPSGVKLSSFGYGTFYTRNGPIDPDITEESLMNEGVRIIGGIVRNMVISSNNFYGIGASVYITPNTKVANSIFSGNSVFDCSSILSCATPNPNFIGILISENIVDIDPYCIHPNRGLDGTYLAQGSPTAILSQGVKGITVKNNTFRNVCRISDENYSSPAVLQGNGTIFVGNIVECEPSSVGFSTSNKGVGQVPTGSENFIIRPTHSNPNSSSYGNIINNCPLEMTAVPTVGTYVQGHFISKSNTQVSGTSPNRYVVMGWKRVTTGSGHVMGTDWVEVRSNIE